MALIIQDAGLLECDLPPLPLIASTQMHNHTPERVAFLEQVGFRRAILARELGLDQIRGHPRGRAAIELECFVHGALCVVLQRPVLPELCPGRAQRQPRPVRPALPRSRTRLLDARRTVAGRAEPPALAARSQPVRRTCGELLDAGVTSFKIEGRLKDRPT